jgi:hypothetical protein
MKTKRTQSIGLIIAAAFAAFGIFRETQPVQATAAARPVTTIDECPPDLICYSVKPSDTDNGKPCSEDGAIGCDDEWGDLAINGDHFLYLPTTVPEGKLLLFLCGGDGNAGGCKNVYPVAAEQGYHVIGLTYPAGHTNDCGSDDLPQEDRLACFGNFMTETVTGVAGPSPGGDMTNVSQHCQDSIVNRLVKVLDWARTNYHDDGWERYLTSTVDVDCLHAADRVNWSRIHLAGFSNGAAHTSIIGTLTQFQSIGRFALFASPNDGDGNTEDWHTADYIQPIEGITDTRYYGLVHVLNKAPDADHPKTYQVTKAWEMFGMEGPLNPDRFEFDPGEPGVPPDFGGSHMLISIDPLPLSAGPTPTPTDAGTTPEEAHSSVVKDRYCSKFVKDTESSDPDDYKCDEYDGATIGYEPAWRCILGTGDVSFSSTPIADAGPNQTVECEGGGASVDLDGSATRDYDCGVLTYTWTWAGSLGVTTGQKPTVFLPVGTHLVTLEVKDEWSNANSKTVLITVQDTQPPTISCPDDIVVEPTCSSGAVVTYTTPVGADGCTGATTTRTAGLASGSIFPIGTTTVTYAATDASNNTASCSFTVKVLTAAEVIQDLISRVQTLEPPLSGQQAQGLRSKLDAALVAINRDQKNVACNKLNDFINQVQTYINNGKLTAAQGQPLINSAAHVRNTLGCTALGCT